MNPTLQRVKQRRRLRRFRAFITLLSFILLTGISLMSRGDELELASEPVSLSTAEARNGEMLALQNQEPGQGDRTGAEHTLEGDAVGGPSAGDEIQDVQPRVFIHEVQPGETLSHIAAAYGIDLETIAAANDLGNLDRIRPGQRLRILSVQGALHTVQRGESLWDISRIYQVPMDEIVRANSLARPDRIRAGDQLIIPGAQAVAYALRREALVGSDGKLLRNFDWPVRGRISSRFGPRWGRMHNGIDLAVPTGTPVRAAAAGTVTFSGWNGGYGNLVVIDHGKGVETRYAHNSRLLVRAGERVKR